MRPNAEIPISTELLRMVMDLPPDYKIVGAYTNPSEFGHTIRLLVEAPSLPAVERGDPRHEVQPIFRRVDTGQALLDRIAVRLSATEPRAVRMVVTR